MSQSPVVLGLDYGGTKIAAAVLGAVAVAVDRVAGNVTGAAGAHAGRPAPDGRPGSVTSADSAPEVTSTGTMA